MPHIAGRQQQRIGGAHQFGGADLADEVFELRGDLRPREIDAKAGGELPRAARSLGKAVDQAVTRLAERQRLAAHFGRRIGADGIVNAGKADTNAPALVERQRQAAAVVNALGRPLTLGEVHAGVGRNLEPFDDALVGLILDHPRALRQRVAVLVNLDAGALVVVGRESVGHRNDSRTVRASRRMRRWGAVIGWCSSTYRSAPRASRTEPNGARALSAGTGGGAGGSGGRRLSYGGAALRGCRGALGNSC